MSLRPARTFGFLEVYLFDGLARDPQMYKVLVNVSAQCTNLMVVLMSSSYRGGDLICGSRATGRSQEFIPEEAEVSLAGKDGKNTPL